MTRGIRAMRTYLPVTRLERDSVVAAHRWAYPSRRHVGKLATANWDEDSITMARTACSDLAVDGHALHFCSTTAPFAERANAGLLRQSLGWPDSTLVVDHGGSMRAGSTACYQQLTHSTGRAIVVAADKRLAKPASEQELQFADAAVAIDIGSDDLVCEYLGGATLSVDFVDRYRSAGEPFGYAFEQRWVRDEGVSRHVPPAIQSALDDAAVDVSAVDHLVANLPARGRQAIAKSVGMSKAVTDSALDEDVGDAGCVQPLLALAEVLEQAKPGATIVIVAFGQGVDVLVLRVNRPVDTGFQQQLAAGRDDSNYLRFLSHRGLLDLDWGKRTERDVRTAQSAYFRESDQISAFVGGRCPVCGTVQFPRTQACVNPDCRHIGEQEPYSLVGAKGRVKSFTEDWQAYSPDPPLIYGNVEFEDGANILMQFTDAQSGEVSVGVVVTPSFRVKDIDERRHFRRYFWKATLARGVH
ncbi:MAG: hypothetical protein AAGH76_03125 [Pseudomonadota bacterium]